MKKLRLFVSVAVTVMWALSQVPATTWYVDDDKSDSNDGSSWANAFATITNAAAALAAAGGSGHLILVTNGYYTPTYISLDNSHAGADGAPNVFRAQGDSVVIESNPGGYYGCFDLDGTAAGNGADYITIDGFTFVPEPDNGYHGHGVRAREAEYLTIKNCTSRTGAAGFFLNPYTTGATIENCTVWGGCRGNGIYVYSGTDVTIKNCIIGAYNQMGLNIANAGTGLAVSNNCIFGNSYANVYLGGVYHTSDAINALDGFGENTTLNPGFADLANNWNFNAFFENSPCRNTADDGGWMGRYQSPTLVPVSAETWYVKSGGNDALSGLDWANAWATITTAAATSGPGDTVMVEAGTYVEDVDITRGGSSNLLVTYEANGTVLVQGSAYPFHLDRVGSVILDGFTIEATAGNAAVYLTWAPTNVIRNCTIDGSTYGVRPYQSPWTHIYQCDISGSSYGVYVANQYAYSYGSVVVDGCTIHDNTVHGYFALGSRNMVKNSTFYNNDDAGIIVNGGSYSDGNDFVNCLSYSNTYGIHIRTHAGGRAYNCTFYGNSEDGMRTGWGYGNTTVGLGLHAYNCIVAGNEQYGARETQQGYATNPGWNNETGRGIFVKNCLFWDNGSGGTNHFLDLTTDPGAGSPWYTNVYGTAEDIDLTQEVGLSTNNIVADPQFVSTAANNYRLKPGSAAIDQADASYTPTYLAMPTTDLAGDPRTKLTGLDIGAYEWQPWSGTVIMVR